MTGDVLLFGHIVEVVEGGRGEGAGRAARLARGVMCPPSSSSAPCHRCPRYRGGVDATGTWTSRREEARRFSYHVAASLPVGRRCRRVREQDRGLRYAAWVRIGFRCRSDAGSGGRTGERTPLTPTPPLHTGLALLTIPPVRALALPHPPLRPRASSIHHPDDDSHGCTTPRAEPTEWQYAMEALGCVQAYFWLAFPSSLLA